METIGSEVRCEVEENARYQSYVVFKLQRRLMDFKATLEDLHLDCNDYENVIESVYKIENVLESEETRLDKLLKEVL
jgi:hypothetical protein